MSTLVRQYTVELKSDSARHKVRTAATGPAVAVTLVRNAEHAPLSAVLRVWEWPVCDYCTRQATRYDKDSGDPLCWDHAVEHNVTATEARRQTGELGTSRLSLVNRSLWAD